VAVAADRFAATGGDILITPIVDAGGLQVTCNPGALAAGWTGTDLVRCGVATADQAVSDVRLSCADLPAGASCTFEPAVVRPRPGADAGVNVRVSYTEGLPAGRHVVRILAETNGVSAAATVAIDKDLNTVSSRCPTADEIKAIDHDLKLVFESDPTRGTRECAEVRELTVMQSRVYRGLATMRRLQFTEPLPWTSEPVYRWLTKSVRGVRFRGGNDNSSCCGPDGLISVRAVVESSPNGSQMGFSLAITQSATMPTDFRLLASFLQLLVHEARHNNGKPHTCGTKDRSIREMGAWGAAYMFQQWLAERTEPGLSPPNVRASLLQATEQICRGQICEQPCLAQ
jgi:hypothetical protein